MRRYIEALTLAVLALVLGLALVGVGPAFADDTQYFDMDGDGHADEWMSYNGYVYKIHIDENGYAVFDSCSNQDYVDIMDTVDPPGGTGGPPDLSDTGGGPVLPDSCYSEPGPSVSPGSTSTAPSSSPNSATFEGAAGAAAQEYYAAAAAGNYTYTYNALSSYSQGQFTEDEWIADNTALGSDEVTYSIDSVNMANDSTAEVHLTITSPDGTSSERTTQFVLENGSWKHDLTPEEYTLFSGATPSGSAATSASSSGAGVADVNDNFGHGGNDNSGQGGNSPTNHQQGGAVGGADHKNPPTNHQQGGPAGGADHKNPEGSSEWIGPLFAALLLLGGVTFAVRKLFKGQPDSETPVMRHGGPHAPSKS